MARTCRGHLDDGTAQSLGEAVQARRAHLKALEYKNLGDDRNRPHLWGATYSAIRETSPGRLASRDPSLKARARDAKLKLGN